MAVHFGIEDVSPITVPSAATESIEGFRKWAGSEEWDKAKLCFLNGEVWVEMGREQLFSHGNVKAEIGSTLHFLTKKYGFTWINGVLLTNHQAALSCNPDVLFVTFESIETKNIVLIEGKEDGYTEIVGSPDMVLEVVSDSSEKKDWFRLREGYFDVGIKEYWIVDARGDLTEFQILKRSGKGFVETKRTAGWMKSAVFGKSFKLTRGKSPQELPVFTLDVK